ncbi:MAG: YccF domain-containing protein [Bacteroidetes bacterium]|nr:YccF domain-containing protein [Bacteroidota bacterium]
MRPLANLLWLLFGGIFIALEYIIASIPLFLSIIGIPLGIQCIKLASLALWPFGSEVRSTNKSSGCISTFLNIIWIFIGGIWICLTHLLFGIVFCLTIIGIPFGRQHFKLAALALAPFGKEIISK